MSPYTHWGHGLFVFDEEHKVARGDEVSVVCVCCLYCLLPTKRQLRTHLNRPRRDVFDDRIVQTYAFRLSGIIKPTMPGATQIHHATEHGGPKALPYNNGGEKQRPI